MTLGGTINFRKQDWRVVGVFDTGGSGFESEIWGDTNLLRQVFKRETGFQSITFRMADPSKGAFDAVKASIETDPKLQLQLNSEAKYYDEQFKNGGTLMTVRADDRYNDASDIVRRRRGYDYETREDRPIKSERFEQETQTKR